MPRSKAGDALKPGVLALLVLLVACGQKEAPAVEDIRPVRSVVVGVSQGSVGATYSGQVQARYESKIGFQQAGRIVTRLVEVGQQVKRGQPLMQLDRQQEVLSLTAAGADLAAAKARLAQSRLDLERTQQLLDKKFASQDELDQQKLALDEAEAKLKSAIAQQQIKTNQRGYTEISSDRDGVVTAIDAEAGQVVSAGQTVVTVAADGEREVRVSISESRVDELRKAARLEISIWADPGKRYEGELRELAPDADSVTRTYSARITVKNPDEALRLGMTASVFAPDVAGATAIRLPLSAIYNKEGQSLVWIVDPANSQVSTRPVQLGGAEGDSVLVTGGLKGGETVVTAGVHMLHAGQKVASPGAAPVAAPAKATQS